MVSTVQRYGKALSLSTVTKETVNRLLTHFFLEIQDTRNGKENAEYEPGTLTTYRNALRRYFLDRPETEGSRFDIGEDQEKKLSSKRKQLKAIGKENCLNACDALDEEQVRQLWSSGVIGLKTPRQLLHLMWWNNTRMLGMRATQEHLDCKLEDFIDTGTNFTFGERSTMFQRHVGLQQQQGRVGLGRVLSHNVCNISPFNKKKISTIFFSSVSVNQTLSCKIHFKLIRFKPSQ